MGPEPPKKSPRNRLCSDHKGRNAALNAASRGLLLHSTSSSARGGRLRPTKQAHKQFPLGSTLRQQADHLCNVQEALHFVRSSILDNSSKQERMRLQLQLELAATRDASLKENATRAYRMRNSAQHANESLPDSAADGATSHISISSKSKGGSGVNAKLSIFRPE